VKHRLYPALTVFALALVCPTLARAQEPSGAQTPPRAQTPSGAQTPSDAQTPSVPASSAAGRSNANAQSELTIGVSLAEAYDQDVANKTGSIAPQLFQGSGSYTTLTPQLEYKSGGGRAQIGISSASSVRYYADLHQTIVTNGSVGLGFNVNLTPRTSIFLNEGVTYSPALLYGLLGNTAGPPALGDAVPSGPNYVLNEQRSYVYDSKLSVTHKITSRASFTVDSGFQYADFTGNDPAYPDLRTENVGGHLDLGLNRGIKLRLGYNLRQGQYIGATKTTEHALDIGIDYTRPISRTRKTEISFSLGPMLENGLLSSATSGDAKDQYRFIGNAAISHQIGRTWKLQGTYHRGMGYYVQGFEKPVFSAAYAASAAGYVNNRTDMSFSAAYSSGDSGLNATQTQFTTYTGDARARFWFSRLWSAYAEYVFYYYKFDNGIPLPADVPPYLTRNGVRVGFTMWAPTRRR
jgi:hypothetical protein